MGWSLELFLKQFIFLNWITKDEAKIIEDNANTPLCTLFVKLDNKLHSDEDKITGLTDELTTLKEQNKKLRECVEESISIIENFHKMENIPHLDHDFEYLETARKCLEEIE